jgi:hypothetical protein
MIELMRIEVAGDRALDLTFSDGSGGRWCAKAVIAQHTVLTRPLSDSAYFARAFIDARALAWPNGLEFSAHSLTDKLAEAGRLERKAFKGRPEVQMVPSAGPAGRAAARPGEKNWSAR